jgi:transcription elongation factor GreA
MPVRETISSILRGEEITDLTPKSRARLEEIVSQAEAERALPWLRDECAGRLKQPHPPITVEYLLAEACAHNGEVERAHQTLLLLGEKLIAGKKWEVVAAVAERALALEETQAAARLLVKAHEGLNRDPARIDALQHAWALMPDDLELGLLLTIRLGEAGQGEKRRIMLAELLSRFATEARYSGLEEAALEFVENEYLDGLVRLVETLPVVAVNGAVREAFQLLDIAFPPLERGGRLAEGLPALRELLTTVIEREPASIETLRPAIVAAIKQGPARELPDAAPVLELSGIEDRMKPLPSALERFDALFALPPGRAVHHGSFGAGRVTFDDGESVMIDFAHARGHRMPYAAARRSLVPIAEDDLRLLVAMHPKDLARLIAEDPAEVVRRALIAVGGAGDVQKLKVFLVGSNLVKAADWTAFWRRARAAIEKSPLVDSSRAFEQHYKIADAALDALADVPLPSLAPRKPVKTNLTTIKKFLSQHPQAERALAQRFGRYVSQAMVDPEGDRVDRARAGVYLARWSPERTPEWTRVLMSLWEDGLSISDLSGEDEQLALLEASHAAGVESDAILSGLDSRFSSVRAAAATLRERLGPDSIGVFKRTLLHHAARYPAAAFREIEEAIARSAPPEEIWPTLVAAFKLIEERPKPSTAEKVLRWLEPGEAFDRLLAGNSCPEPLRLQIRVLLLQWRSSDRLLFPALEAADRLGLVEEVEAVRGARHKKSEKLFQGVGQVSEDTDLAVMTRATWERLKSELERLERELRTTIPATIQKARELGDLKENAEYHSAKLKQANVSRIVASLQKRLLRARFVDDAEHRDGIVGLGTEVALESDVDVVTFWILGEDEHHHGANVISFQAPVGRALVGHTIGDEIEIGEGEQRRRYRIVSVDRKLPPSESSAAIEPA